MATTKIIESAKNGVQHGGTFTDSKNILFNITSKLKASADVGNIQSHVILWSEKSSIPFAIIGAKVCVSKANDLKSTFLVSRRGSVKELIQAKDYEVKISGTLIGARDIFPLGELTLLNQVLEDSQSILVASPYLAAFRIFRLAFKSATFDQGGASGNVLPFTLTFESDSTCDFDVSKGLSGNTNTIKQIWV